MSIVGQHTQDRYVFIVIPTDELDLARTTGFYPNNKEGFLEAPFNDLPEGLPVTYACWFNRDAFTEEWAREMAEDTSRTYNEQFLARMRAIAMEGP